MGFKGFRHSEEAKTGICEALRGQVPWNEGLTKETDSRLAKLSELYKGQVPWNKGLTKETDKGVEEQSRKMKGHKAWNKGVPRSEGTKEKIGRANKGKPCWNKGLTRETDNRVRRVSEALRGPRGPNWIDGRTPLVFSIRQSFKYRLWRSDVFTRDDFTCQGCGRRGGKLNAHHIEPFSLILELNDVKTLEQAMDCEELWNINNGITYCKKCHLKRKKGGTKCLDLF